jgi:hypothetical protein
MSTGFQGAVDSRHGRYLGHCGHGVEIAEAGRERQQLTHNCPSGRQPGEHVQLRHWTTRKPSFQREQTGANVRHPTFSDTAER